MPELDLAVDTVLACDPAQVLEDLGPAGIDAAPVVVGLEREGVVVRLDVAGDTGVGVGPPGAAELGLKVKDLVRGQVQLRFKTDGGTDAREAGREVKKGGGLVMEVNVGFVRTNKTYVPCSNDADSGRGPILVRLCVSHLLRLLALGERDAGRDGCR